MSHFAYVINGRVENVIVAEQDFIDGLPPQPGQWIQTSYNTYGGVHLQGGTPLRWNYAIIGGTYDAERDAFIPPKPYHSWQLDPASLTWQAPVAVPQDGKTYDWNEDSRSWQVSPYQYGEQA